jgi:hypothetical protein
MLFAYFLLAIPICIADLSTFTIPNIYNKLLAYSAIIHVSIFGIGNVGMALMGVMVLGVLLLLRVGMGDLKLLFLISVVHQLHPIQLLVCIVCVASAHIVILTGVHRVIPTRIPLAPSIFLGLATYLATR